MKRWKEKGIILLLLLFTVFIIVGCSSEGSTEGNEGENTEIENENNNGESESENNNDNNNGNNNENEDEDEGEDLEPVTLLLMTHWSDEQFERDFKGHVEEAFDHITLEHVSASVDDIEEEIFAKEIYPDIIMTSVSDYLLDMDLLLDLNPLIEEFDFDLDRLEPSVVEYLKDQSNDGELNGLPFIRPEYALVYNPDVFDAFGVDYPTDDMTWDEVIDLAKDVTGEIDGEQYRGLYPGDFMMRQIEDSQLVDPDTDEPIIDGNEGFKVFLERLEEIYSISGNMPESAEDMVNESGLNLIKDEHTAMAADRAFAHAYAGPAAERGLGFDFVTFPKWGEEFGDYGPNEPGNGLVATTTSEHPEEAFRVIEFLLSDDYQTWLSENGDLPAVITEEVRDAFLTGNEHYEEILSEKNLEAITSVEAAPLPDTSPYEKDILEDVDYLESIYEGMDVNSIIREMQDKAEGNAKNIRSK